MFIAFLYTFRATMCPSSAENTVSMRHLVFVTLWDDHLQTVTIPDAVSIQFDLPMMSTMLLETCRGLY